VQRGCPTGKRYTHYHRCNRISRRLRQKKI